MWKMQKVRLKGLRLKVSKVSICRKKSQLWSKLLISRNCAVIVRASTRKEIMAMPTNRFRNTVEKVMNNSESYSNEDLRYLFLEMTERFLNELLSTMNYEKAIIESLGEEEGNKVIEKAAISNPVINAVDSDNGKEDEIEYRITNLLNAIEKMQTNESTSGTSSLRLQ